MSESYVSCYMQVPRFVGDYKNKTFLLVIKHQRMQEGHCYCTFPSRISLPRQVQVNLSIPTNIQKD